RTPERGDEPEVSEGESLKRLSSVVVYCPGQVHHLDHVLSAGRESHVRRGAAAWVRVCPRRPCERFHDVEEAARTTCVKDDLLRGEIHSLRFFGEGKQGNRDCRQSWDVCKRGKG